MNKEQGMMNDEVGGLFWIDRLRVLRRTQCGIFPLSKITWPKIAVPNISSFEHFRWISKQDRKFFGRRHDAEWCANVLSDRTLTAEVVIKKRIAELFQRLIFRLLAQIIALRTASEKYSACRMSEPRPTRLPTCFQRAVFERMRRRQL